MPIRDRLHIILEFEPEHSPANARDVVEWFKYVVTATADMDLKSEMETALINDRWIEIATAWATTQAIPSGIASAFLNRIATLEMELLQTAEEEAKYGRPAQS